MSLIEKIIRRLSEGPTCNCDHGKHGHTWDGDSGSYGRCRETGCNCQGFAARQLVKCSDPNHEPHAITRARAYEGGTRYYCTRAGYPGDPNDVRG